LSPTAQHVQDLIIIMSAHTVYINANTVYICDSLLSQIKAAADECVASIHKMKPSVCPVTAAAAAAAVAATPTNRC